MSNNINNSQLLYQKLQELVNSKSNIQNIDNIIQQYVEYYKKGNKIHIKKKNRGKFTEYCGGKVTSECIRKGKNSPNPAIRKRATFAANARKWNKK